MQLIGAKHCPGYDAVSGRVEDTILEFTPSDMAHYGVERLAELLREKLAHLGVKGHLLPEEEI